VKSLLATFFRNGIAVETACEGVGNCNMDMQSYKGIVHRALGSTARLAPYTRDTILPVLKSSATAAVKTCSQGDNGRMCGFVWAEGGGKSRRQTGDDSDVGTGSKPASINASAQMSVLGALMSLMEGAPGNGTQTTGGTGGSGTGSGTKTSSSSVPTNAAMTAGITRGAKIAAFVGTGAAFVVALA